MTSAGFFPVKKKAPPDPTVPGFISCDSG